MSEIKRAEYIVHWPGRDVPACKEHREKLEALGWFMGFSVSTTPTILDEACTNCENEAKKTNAEDS